MIERLYREDVAATEATDDQNQLESEDEQTWSRRRKSLTMMKLECVTEKGGFGAEAKNLNIQ